MRNIYVYALFLLFLVATPGCFLFGSQSSDFNYRAHDRDPRRLPYVVGPGDVLSIHVWRDEELSGDVRVRPDGTITLPLVGEVQAAGRTTAALREEIAKKVELFVKDAVVTVALTAINSYRFTVTGEVGHPGVFTPLPYVTISEAIALAGGPSRYASRDSIILIRRGEKEQSPERIRIDYDGILKGKRPEQDIVVLAGDTIYVP